MAWRENKQRLEAAIASRSNHAFETTLGGHTIAALLHKACDERIAVRIWYCALATVDLPAAFMLAMTMALAHSGTASTGATFSLGMSSTRLARLWS